MAKHRSAASPSASGLGARLRALRPALARAAQKVVDEWAQDDEGVDEEFGTGGACDAVARAMDDVIGQKIPEARLVDGGHEGDDHAFLVVLTDDEAYVVDVPASVYETGGGYRWRKRVGARVMADDVVVERVRRSDFDDR